MVYDNFAVKALSRQLALKKGCDVKKCPVFKGQIPNENIFQGSKKLLPRTEQRAGDRTAQCGNGTDAKQHKACFEQIHGISMSVLTQGQQQKIAREAAAA